MPIFRLGQVRRLRRVGHGSLHSSLRISCKTLLQGSRKRISKTSHEIRSRECIEVIPYRLVAGMKLDCKTLFTLFLVFEQRSVGKSEFFMCPMFLNYVHDPAGIKGPESEM